MKAVIDDKRSKHLPAYGYSGTDKILASDKVVSLYERNTSFGILKVFRVQRHRRFV